MTLYKNIGFTQKGKSPRFSQSISQEKQVTIQPRPSVFIGNARKHSLDMDADDRAEIEQILGYHFFEKQYLIRALTHPAYADEQFP
jgi:hypothetical protein